MGVKGATNTDVCHESYKLVINFTNYKKEYLQNLSYFLSSLIK